MSKIEWTEKTWNPIVGCSVVSPGCTNCYAMGMAARLERMGMERYVGLTRPSKAGPVWTGETRLVKDTLTEPLRRRKPTMWFVNSMSDLFHESVPDAWIDRVFAVMALAPQHTFQVLTKRSARMRAYLCDPGLLMRLRGAVCRQDIVLGAEWASDVHFGASDGLPLPNVWLGVSAEDQRRADERVPDLLATPAAVRFVSAEPLLGPINFVLRGLPGWDEDWKLDALTGKEWASPRDDDDPPAGAARLDWVIVGGESGPGARPMHPDWARSIRDQCEAAGVAFFHKQNGEWAMRGAKGIAFPDATAAPCVRLTDTGDNDSVLGASGRHPVWLQRIGKKAAGRLLDGVEHSGMPAGAGAGR